MTTHYYIMHDEVLSRSIEGLAKRIVKLDWPTDLSRVLESGCERELVRWERNELHLYLRELI